MSKLFIDLSVEDAERKLASIKKKLKTLQHGIVLGPDKKAMSDYKNNILTLEKQIAEKRKEHATNVKAFKKNVNKQIVANIKEAQKKETRAVKEGVRTRNRIRESARKRQALINKTFQTPSSERVTDLRKKHTPLIQQTPIQQEAAKIQRQAKDIDGFSNRHNQQTALDKIWAKEEIKFEKQENQRKAQIRQAAGKQELQRQSKLSKDIAQYQTGVIDGRKKEIANMRRENKQKTKLAKDLSKYQTGLAKSIVVKRDLSSISLAKQTKSHSALQETLAKSNSTLRERIKAEINLEKFNKDRASSSNATRQNRGLKTTPGPMADLLKEPGLRENGKAKRFRLGKGEYKLLLGI